MDNRPNAVLILVFGILGIVFCPLFGIPAWILGNSGLQVIGSYDANDASMVKIGRILGIIGTAMCLCGALFFILWLLAAAGMIFYSTTSGPTPVR